MVSPFDAPSIITPAYLVNVSTNYQRQADFFNYGLGKTFEDQEATLMRSDFDELFVRKEAGPGSYVMGADVGAIWHIMVARVDGYGALFIVHSEQVPMGSAKRRYEELRLKYNVICTVADAYPHSESIMALQDIDDNMYAGVFTKLKDLTTHKVINRGEDREEGVQFKRSVNINRDRALDAVLNIVRGKQVVFRDSDLKETIISHHLDMFRARQFDTSTGELSYHWQKSAQGQDHFMFALLYAYIASRIMGVSRTTIQLPTAGVFSFRLKQK
jgi:alpha-ketoglutarate-dependent taurine dioxygenase